MTPLFTGIYSMLAGSALATNYIGAKMYLNEAPQKTAFPYVTFELVTGTYDWTFCADMEFDDCLVQFNLFSKQDVTNDTEVNGMFADLTALYDWCVLAVAPYTFLYMRRELFHLMRDIDAGVWQYVVQYRVLLQS